MLSLPKPWHASATLWLNGLAAVALVVGIILDSADVLHLPGPWVAYLTVALAIANALIRYFRTSQPIAGSPVSPPAPH